MATTEFGHEGTLTIGQVAQQIRDLTLDLSASEVDKTTRANAGWRARGTGLKQWGASFEMVVVQGDTIYDTLSAAFAASTEITVTIKDKFNHTCAGKVSVSTFTRNEPLDNVVTVNVSLIGSDKPTTFN